jgi:hypothetical protein
MREQAGSCVDRKRVHDVQEAERRHVPPELGEDELEQR